MQPFRSVKVHIKTTGCSKIIMAQLGDSKYLQHWIGAIKRHKERN